MLEARHLSASLGGRLVIREIDAALQAGELVGVIGANGSGKSTFLKTLAGLLSPDSGEVLLNGIPLTGHPLRERAKLLAYCHRVRNVIGRFRSNKSFVSVDCHSAMNPSRRSNAL